MRALSVAIGLMLLVGTAHAQSQQDPSSKGSGYGAGASGLGGYGYSTGGSGSGNNPSGHYGGGYIRDNGTFQQPQDSSGGRFGAYGTRENDPRADRTRKPGY